MGVHVFLPVLPLFSPFFSWVHFVSFLQLFFLPLIPCLCLQPWAQLPRLFPRSRPALPQPCPQPLSPLLWSQLQQFLSSLPLPSPLPQLCPSQLLLPLLQLQFHHPQLVLLPKVLQGLLLSQSAQCLQDSQSQRLQFWLLFLLQDRQPPRQPPHLQRVSAVSQLLLRLL